MPAGASGVPPLTAGRATRAVEHNAQNREFVGSVAIAHKRVTAPANP
jgi:hypothetical protein